MNDDAPLKAVARLSALRFILQFSARGGANYGASGMSAEVTTALDRAGLVEVFDYKPFNPRVRTPRRYRKVVVPSAGQRFATLLREELRARNLASIADIGDGVGRVAFEADYRLRRADVQAAAARALERWRADG